jgi:lipid-A-disaccharide synthase
VSGLLVVAGEASGDRAAAGVVRRLAGVRAFGLGGAALAASGADVVTDLRDLTAMGVLPVGSKSFAIGKAALRLLSEATQRRPEAALLVNYTEFNARLAALLHPLGVRILWYVAPQIWAWRPGRAAMFRRIMDRLAVVLPFEEALWREIGVDAHYVGHPAFETTPLPRDVARRALDLTPFAQSIAVLPGSRPHEVKRHLPVMLEGYEQLRIDRASVDGRVLVAASLPENVKKWTRELARHYALPVFDVDGTLGASSILGAFDAVLCASGTASLEAALAGVPPVVLYRVDALTALVARAALRTPHIALPNVLLGRRAFPELLQGDATPARVADELGKALRNRAKLAAECAEVRAIMGTAHTPSLEVASMLLPWLGPGASVR